MIQQHLMLLFRKPEHVTWRRRFRPQLLPHHGTPPARLMFPQAVPAVASLQHWRPVQRISSLALAVGAGHEVIMRVSSWRPAKYELWRDFVLHGWQLAVLQWPSLAGNFCSMPRQAAPLFDSCHPCHLFPAPGYRPTFPPPRARPPRLAGSLNRNLHLHGFIFQALSRMPASVIRIDLGLVNVMHGLSLPRLFRKWVVFPALMSNSIFAFCVES